MPRIRLILEDDEGNPILDATPQVYQLESECDTLNEIEHSVEGFKQQALPEVERSLLARAQQRFLTQEKKQTPLRLNGKERVWIKTIHGSFEFTEQRFLLPDGSPCHYLRQGDQSLFGSMVKELCLYYCNRLSFAEVGRLLERVSGERVVCEQTLWNWAQQKAQEVSATLASEVVAFATTTNGSSSSSPLLPAVDGAVDIYDAQAEEVLVMTDAIQVKAQKPTRTRCGDASKPSSNSSSSEEGKKVKRISTYLMLLEGQDGAFRYLSAGLGEGAPSLLEVTRAHLQREWAEHPRALLGLPIVAITDGARSIRVLPEDLFAPTVRVILDWYHLSKKVYQLLSMVAHGKAEREQMQEKVLGFLALSASW